MHWSFSSSFWSTLDGTLQTNNRLDNSAFEYEIDSTCSHFQDTGIFQSISCKAESIRDYMFDRSASKSNHSLPYSFSNFLRITFHLVISVLLFSCIPNLKLKILRSSYFRSKVTHPFVV